MLTCEDLTKFGLQLLQPRQGYRYSLDALLLTRFCPELKPESRIVDLGAGCGIISLVLARFNPEATVLAVENNSDMASLVERNIQLNDLAGRVTVCADDVLSLRAAYPVSSVDLVVSNPPFRSPKSGKISPHSGRDSARHETTAGLADFLAIAKYLVKPGGRICFIYHPSRLAEFITAAAGLKLSLLRLRMVHGSSGSTAKMFLAELAKGRKSDITVEAPLIVYDSSGNYTDEVSGILG